MCSKEAQDLSSAPRPIRTGLEHAAPQPHLRAAQLRLGHASAREANVALLQGFLRETKPVIDLRRRALGD